MRSLPVLLVAASVLIFFRPARAASPAIDPILQQGLQTCVTNGVDSGVRQWYADRPGIAAEMSEKVAAASRNLGAILDSEVVVIQPISKRVTRYYVALYFERSPLWIRIERYASRDRAFYLPLKCSVDPDDILPGYVTNFLQSP